MASGSVASRVRIDSAISAAPRRSLKRMSSLELDAEQAQLVLGGLGLCRPPRPRGSASRWQSERVAARRRACARACAACDRVATPSGPSTRASAGISTMARGCVTSPPTSRSSDSSSSGRAVERGLDCLASRSLGVFGRHMRAFLRRRASRCRRSKALAASSSTSFIFFGLFAQLGRHRALRRLRPRRLRRPLSRRLHPARPRVRSPG